MGFAPGHPLLGESFSAAAESTILTLKLCIYKKIPTFIPQPAAMICVIRIIRIEPGWPARPMVVMQFLQRGGDGLRCSGVVTSLCESLEMC